MEEQKIPHSITIENRRKITVTGVNDIDKFDENMIVLFTVEGELIIRGKGFKVSDLNSDTKTFRMDGHVTSMLYGGERHSKNVVKKILR